MVFTPKPSPFFINLAGKQTFMSKLTFVLFLLSISSISVFAQKTGASPLPVISLKASKALKNRCTTYKTTMHIADSLWAGYMMEPFYVETENSGSYESGSSLLLNLYRKAQEIKPNSEMAATKVAMMQDVVNQETAQNEAKEYNKIITKAEEYYTNGNLDKAIELYERAVVFKPSDEKAKARLEELKSLKK